MAKDPICGMTVDEKVAEKKNLFLVKDGKSHHFCSTTCKEKFENKVPWYRSEKFGKLFPYFLALVLIGGTILSLTYDFMLLYMGIFFILFSLFKMPDWKGFVTAFSGYDLIAKNIKIYAWAYPAIEFIIGIFYIINYYVGNFFLVPLAWITLFIMGVGGIGVSIKLLKKEKFQCACLGTWINVPLTKVTLLEDLLMIFMAIVILI